MGNLASSLQWVFSCILYRFLPAVVYSTPHSTYGTSYLMVSAGFKIVSAPRFSQRKLGKTIDVYT